MNHIQRDIACIVYSYQKGRLFELSFCNMRIYNRCLCPYYAETKIVDVVAFADLRLKIVLKIG